MNIPGLRGANTRTTQGAAGRVGLALSIVMVLSLAGMARAAEMPALEYQIKAAYLYNFLRYVEWPPGTQAGGTFLVCVFGKERFGTALDSVVGEKIRGQVIAIRAVSETGQLNDCRLVFVDAAERETEAAILQQLAGRAVLTIGETPGFADRGGVINLIRVKDKIRFEINQQAAERGGLKISSQLLQLAVRK